jgi:hypothetical protein
MDADGQRAHKLIYALLLVTLTAALVWTLRKGEPAPAQRIEAGVDERARPLIVNAIRNARQLGDAETADWLENLLRTQDAQRDTQTRRAASAGH